VAKTMPPQAFNAISGREINTVKRCPPFVDAMTHGFLIPLMCDLRFENGEIIWDQELPPGGAVTFVRAPIGFHESSQVAGTPLFEPDRFLIKFHNLWTIEAPQGYAVLFTHPLNRFDLPFTTLTGLVDCDRYHDNWVHFPAHWHDPEFTGVLAKGTPIAQCVPVRRENWYCGRRRLRRRTHNGRTTSPTRSTASRGFIGSNSAPEQAYFCRNFAALLGRRKKRPCDGMASDMIARPVICGMPRAASRMLASPASRSPISIRHTP
jgi:hypothetical protein